MMTTFSIKPGRVGVAPGAGKRRRRVAAAGGAFQFLSADVSKPHPQPFSLHTAAARTAQIPEFAAPLSEAEYVRRLLAAHEKLVADATRARDLAGAAGDQETQDLMVNRITVHQKTRWMLQSFLKG
jgi:hypothetical protein